MSVLVFLVYFCPGSSDIILDLRVHDLQFHASSYYQYINIIIIIAKLLNKPT